MRFEIQSGGAIDGFAGIAGGKNRQCTVPAGGEQEHGVDIGTACQGAEAIAHAGGPTVGDFGGSMSDRIAERSHLEAVGQRTESRGMAGFPCLAETNDADAKFHEEQGARSRERGAGSEVIN
jgi:hypothetical protein